MPRKKALPDPEEEFEKSMVNPDEDRWQGVILYSKAEDRFDYMPSEGYPGCESLPNLSDIDLQKTNLSRADRLKAFKIVLPGEEEGHDAYVFLRVENGKSCRKATLPFVFVNVTARS